MDFELDDDQRQLESSSAEVLAKECPPSYLRGVIGGTADPDALWSTLVGLDWPSLTLPEGLGGVGLTTVELALVLEQLGYVADPTPMLATTSQFVPVVLACGDAEQQQRFLAPVATDGASGTLALAGADGRWDARSPAVDATQVGECWQLTGATSFVLDGDRAREIAVVARTSSGSAVFVVPADAVRSVRRTRSFDATLHVTDVDFDGVTVTADRRLAGADPIAGVERALEESVTGVAMTTIGACQRVLDMVIEYVGQREQFGVPVGSFQAVKHKVVDMYLALERARALGLFAALTIAEHDARRTMAASMAKAAAGDAQRIVFQHGIQLFGGIGYTWENDVHLYLRRAKAGELLLGGADHHRQVVGQLTLAGVDGSTGG